MQGSQTLRSGVLSWQKISHVFSITFRSSSSVSLLFQDLLRTNEERCSARTFKVLSFFGYHEWASRGEVRDKLVFSVY